MSGTQPAGTPAERLHLSDLCQVDDGTDLVCLAVLPCAEHPADTPEPSTPPAQPPGERRAAAGGHPGTLDGPGVLGRALLDANGDPWPLDGRGEAEANPPVREVLLVDPAAWERHERLADAARQWRTIYGDGPAWPPAERALAAAVDAYYRPTTGGDINDDLRWMVSDKRAADLHPPADDQLCEDLDCGCCYPGGMEESQPTGEEVIRYAAFVAALIPAGHRAATQAVIHGMLQDGWQRPADRGQEPDNGVWTDEERNRLAACPRRWGDWDDLRQTDGCPDCGWGRVAHPTDADVRERAAEPAPEPCSEVTKVIRSFGTALGNLIHDMQQTRSFAPAPEPAAAPTEPPISYQVSSRPFGGRCHHCYAVTSGPDVGEGCPHCGVCGAEFTDGGGRGRHCGRNAGHKGGHALAEPALAVNPAWAGSCLCEDREAHDPDCRQGHGPECDADCWDTMGCPRRHRHDPEPAPEPAVVKLAPGVHWLGEIVGDQPPDDSHSLTDHARLPTGPAPEPAGDGPGWQRESITELIRMLRNSGVTTQRHHADQVDALLLHFDTMNVLTDNQLRQAEGYVRRAEDQAETAEAERHAARAELEEERDRRAVNIETAGILADDLAAADIEIDRLRAELATARRDGSTDTLAWVLHGDNVCDNCKPRIETMRAQVIAGSVPGSPEPAPDGGEEPS